MEAKDIIEHYHNIIPLIFKYGKDTLYEIETDIDSGFNPYLERFAKYFAKMGATVRILMKDVNGTVYISRDVFMGPDGFIKSYSRFRDEEEERKIAEHYLSKSVQGI